MNIHTQIVRRFIGQEIYWFNYFLHYRYLNCTLATTNSIGKNACLKIKLFTFWIKCTQSSILKSFLANIFYIKSPLYMRHDCFNFSWLASLNNSKSTYDNSGFEITKHFIDSFVMLLKPSHCKKDWYDSISFLFHKQSRLL